MEWFDNENNPIGSIQNVSKATMCTRVSFVQTHKFEFQIRHILGNGSLYFPPFQGESFRQDVHWATYKCIAANSIGTIVSRDVFIKAGKRLQGKPGTSRELAQPEHVYQLPIHYTQKQISDKFSSEVYLEPMENFNLS